MFNAQHMVIQAARRKGNLKIARLRREKDLLRRDMRLGHNTTRVKRHIRTIIKNTPKE
jgi:hypothetical protein